MGVGKFIADALSEDESQPSGSRLLSSVVILVTLGLLVAVVVVTLRSPGRFTLADDAAFMTALAAFDASVVGVLYGINKVSTAVSDVFTSRNNQPPHL